MMTLLEKHSLNPVAQFEPESQPLNLAERASTTTITVGPAAPEISVGDWIRDDTEPGEGIVWRVKTVDEQFDTETRTFQLEHIINTLRKVHMFGEVKPADMAGTPGATTCTATQAIEYILSKQSDWVLGICSYDVSNPYNFNGDYLFDALETVSSSLADCWWYYDMSSYPFTINIVERESAVSVEMRMRRNISKAKRTVDESRMYTRIYPTGKNNLHIDGDYISKNENIYGRIDKPVTDQSKATKAELYRWAEELLNRHCEPSMTVTVSALDLSKGTGESLDHIVLGAKCRMPLPKYNVLIQEIITKISYADKIKDSTSATVTMANIREDVASIINQLIKSGGASGRASAKQAEEDHAWIDDTTDHVKLVAEAFIGKDGQNPVDWSRVAQLGVDQDGISGRVTKTEDDIVTAQTSIEANEEAINAEVTRATGAETEMSGRLEVMADKVGLVVNSGSDQRPTRYYDTLTDFPVPGDPTKRYYELATGKYYEWLGDPDNTYHEIPNGFGINAGEICTWINESGDPEALISASKIYLLGQTIANTITASYIASKISSIASLLVQNVTGEVIEASTVKIRPVAGMGAVSVATRYNGSSLTRSGNTYTLRLAKFNGDYDEYSFSRATTLSGAWSGRRFTVTASPQGEEFYTDLWSAVPLSNITWDGTVATLNLNAALNGGETTYSAGSVTVNVGSFLQDKTGTTNKITANGLYSADSGYIGFGDIEIDVPQSTVEPTTLSIQWNGSRQLTANANPQGVSRYTTIVSAIPTSDISISGTTLTLPLKATYDGGETTVNVGNITVNISNQLTAENNSGRAAVTLNDPTWNSASGAVTSRTVTVSTSGRKNASGVTDNLSKSVELFLTQDNWSSNKKTVRMRAGSTSGTTYAQVEVDASSLVTNAGYAGRAAVGLAEPTWNAVSGATPTSRTVTVETTGRTTSAGAASNLSKSVGLYLTQGSWSSNKLTVFMRAGGTSGTVYAQTEVNASTLVTNANYAGRAAVNLGDPRWNTYSGSMPASRVVYVDTTGRTDANGNSDNKTKAVGLYLTEGSWGGTNNSVKTVYMREGSTSGTTRAQITIDATSRYANGWNANRNAWLDYGALTDYQGPLNEGSFVKTVTSDINGNSVNNSRGGYWFVPSAWFLYRDAAGSNHQGNLQGGKYIELVYTRPNNGTPKSTGSTWYVPESGPSYSHSATLYCYEITTGSTGVKTCRFSVQYSASQSVPFSSGHSYSMHW